MGNGSVDGRRRLVDAIALWCGVDADGFAALLIDGKMVLNVHHHTIGQLDVLPETAGQHFAQQAHIVLLQILIHVPARHLYEESPRLFVVVLEDDGREPCFVLLLSDDLPDEFKAVVPKRLWIVYHAALPI